MTYKKTLDQLSVAASQRVKEREYWFTKLSGFRQKSRFPLDYNRKETAPHRMKTVNFEFSRQLSEALIKLGADSDVRLHMILVAGLSALLHRYLQAYDHPGTDAVSAAANGSDIVVGAPILRPDVEADFINTNLVLRNLVYPHMTFKELLLGVRQTVTEALGHRNYPVEVLAEQLDMSCTAEEEFPLFDIAVVVENIHDKKFLHPLRLNMIFSFTRRDSVVEGCLEYNPLLYKDGTASRLVAHLQRLLSDVSTHLETRVSALDLMSPDERERLLSQFNNTTMDYPADKTLHELFEQKAEAVPNRTAVVGTGFSLSYGDLKEKSDRLAGLLREKGDADNTIVGILTDRSLEMVIGILGILKSGAAYLPIDPAYPGKRIDYILQDSGAKILLSEASRVSEIGCDIEVIDLKENMGPIGPIGPIIKELPTHPAHLCYIIYTSGSTGKPKGVMVEHRSVVNILFDQLDRYPFAENDTYLLKTSFVFDVSVTELFGWFMGGGRLAVLEKGAEKDPRKMLDAIREYRVTHLNFVPALFNAFVEILDPGNVGHLIHLKYLFLAGEKLWPELVKKFQARISGTGCDIVLENIYGPTEATIYACGYSLSGWDGESDIPIGKPLGNITLHILNQNGDMQPIGIPGELCIAGVGLARGYLNRPELTAEKFNRSYNKSYRTYTLYKTGDIAMWLPNGNIAFLGRIDHQVKVRGFRIELGEIENHLLNHTNVKEVKVTALKTGAPGVAEEVALCAYIVPAEPDGQLSIPELREYLSLQLPDYMVPAYFVPLSEMPLTPTGKIDIKALPGPQVVSTGADYIAPRDAIEEKLVEIWKEVLNTGTAPIGIEDNFFHLGGHSLKATTMVYRLYQELGVNIEIADVFDHPTIRGLAGQVKDFRKEEYIEIEPVLEEDGYDLSFAQRRLWVLCQFEEDSTAYNMPGAFTISGPLNAAAFARALQALVDRHESLRTVFISVNGDPRQKVIPTLQCPLEQIDLRHLDDEDKDEETRNIYRENSNRAFDLENGPLFRFKLVRWEEESYVVIFNIHHIVNDGWSQGIIYNDIVRLYNAFLKNEDNPLPPLKLQYKDYSRWHNRLIQSNYFDQSRHYWLEKFKDKPNGIELPLDHSRQPIQTFNGGRIAFTLDEKKTAQLNRLSLQEDGTLFMSLLTLLNIFLFKYSGQKDIIIGSPIANRKRPELHHMVGFLVNTLIYRNQVDPGKSFRELLAETKQEALTCYRFQDYPFDLLVEELGLDRDMSQSPLFNVMLAHNNADTEDIELRLEGVRVSEFSHHGDFNMSKFDLIFFMDEFDDQVSIRIEYNSDLFERSSIERMPGNFLRLVEQIVDNDGMDISISELKIISCDQYERIIRRFNATHHPFPPLTLQQMVESQAEESGEKTALVYNGEHVTYKELDQRTNRLAHYLREEFCVQSNDIIGVSVDRSIDMIVTLLGIMKSGAAYLALDPSSPESRILYMLQDSQANLLVTDKTAQQLFRDYNGSIIDTRSVADKMAAKSTRSPAIVTKASDILYVTYTSGSTGKPNGAVVSHDILTNLIRWQKEKTSVDGSLRCLQFASINFDVSFQEIMSTLTAGGELHLIGEMERKDIDYLMGFLSMHCIEILYLPFYYLNFLFTETDRWSESYRHSLMHLVTAGEQLIITPELKSFLDLNPGVQLHNHYGPAEMHVVTSYTLDASTAGQRTLPPIGKPISNVNIYILDECEQPVPVGVWGEIYIVGPSSFVGYLNKPDLTDRKLLKAGVCSDGKRLYRSGDIARWKEDGNIELRGRKDFQVKIRGFRIELGEIESKLLAVENIHECVVVVKEDHFHQKYLVAYVSVDNIDIPEIRKRISNQLPQYMIPHLVVLDKLPLMHNGKVDRKRLPEPQLEMEMDYTAPRDRVEETLAEIWAEMLGMEKNKIGIDANFFELGGHSLKATLMISQIQKQLGKRIPLAEVFKATTIRELAAYLKGVETQKYAVIPSAKEKDFYVLSPAQKRLYILQQMEADNISYNLPVVVVLEGELDKEKLENTFHRLIVRHESLRTSFEMRDGEPVQKIHPPDAVAFEIECYPAAPDSSSSLPLISEFIRAFDLSRHPLLRVGLIEVEQNKHIAMYDMHHIIADGVSIGILAREFMALYGGEVLPALNLHYKDYSEWQASTERKEAICAQEEYWVKQFEGDIPVLDLPADHHRPRVQSFEGRSVFFQVGQKETRALEQIALGESATLYMVLLSLYNIFVSKLSGREDVVVGTPTAGRSHADMRPVIGMFVNTLALRNYPEGEKPFNVFLKEVKERTLEAFENQDYPFEDLVEKVEVHRDAGRNPLFDVMFALQNMDIDEVEIPGLKLMPYLYENRTSKFDLTLQGAEADGVLTFKFEYSTKLFKDSTINRFINYFKQLILSVLYDPSACIAGLCLISKDEKRRLLVDFNNTDAQYPADKTIHQLFEEQVTKIPGNIAVVGMDGQRFAASVTYRELSETSNRVAGLLKEKGVESGSIVGIMVERSQEMVIGILGILKAGGAYLPIEPAYPQERIHYMLEDSGAKILLSEVVEVGGDIEVIDLDRLIDPMGPIGPIFKKKLPSHPTHLSYIIYTSGSTGKPKGVVVEHRSVVNILCDLFERYPFGENDTYLLKTSYVFDVSVTELFGWFLGGGRLAVLEKDGEKDPQTILDAVEGFGVSHINFVPAMFYVFLEALNSGNTGRLAGLRYIFLAGEALPPWLVEKFQRLNLDIALENIYGPTEGTVYVSQYPLAQWDGSGNILIGKPMRNIRLYILDKYGNIQPTGVVGELCISGTGLARGYLNNPQLTAEKFDRSYKSYRSYISYKTGDLARWLADGNIEFLGRMDHQVKIRGFRVEPGEIESRLLNHEALKEVVVTEIEREDGEKYLCAYIVPLHADDERNTPGTVELREYLSRFLPGYMIPTYFVPLKNIPLNPSGKVDRKQLPLPGAVASGVVYAAPRDMVEQQLVTLWSHLLLIEKNRIGINDNFFHLGGHSLKGTLLISEIHKTFNVKMPLGEMFKTPTIKGLSKYIREAAEDRYAAIVPVGEKNYYRLSSAQKRLYLVERMADTGTGYNMPAVVKLEGIIERDRLENGFRQLILRHESFRTSFSLVEGQPMQQVHQEVDFEIEYYRVEHGARSTDDIIKTFIRPFDLAQAPLLRVGLIKLPGERGASHVLMVDMHHIISDGISLDIVVREFAALYGGETLAPLNLQYKDFAEWQNSEAQRSSLVNQEDYWKEQFQGEIPVLALPMDHPRPVVQRFEGNTISFDIGIDAVEALTAVALEQGVTPYMILFALYNIFISKITGQEDIVTGTPTAGRRHAGLEQVVGMFVNTLAVRSYPTGEKTFTAFLAEIKATILTAFENQDYQYEDLVEQVAIRRDTGRNPLFDTVFAMQQRMEGSAIEIPDLKVSPYDYRNATAKFDLTLHCIENGGNLRFAFECSTALFNETTILRFTRYFRRLVSDVLADGSRCLEELEILPEQEKRQVLFDFNNTAREYPGDKTLHRLFEEQVEKTPGKIALIATDGITLTYRQLKEKAQGAAAWLMEKGVTPGSIVGILGDRSPGMVAGILGILKTGGVYLPIDVDYPEERQNYMLKDSGAGILLDTREQGTAEISSTHPSFSPSSLLSSSPAYIMYTSGSTGRPKGVVVTHRNVVRLVKNTNFVPLNHETCILQTGAPVFDATTFELWGSLLNGGQLVLTGKEVILDAHRLAHALEEYRVNTLWLSAPLFNQLMQQNIQLFSPLRYLLVGGDTLSPAHINRVKQRFPRLNIINGYGPTENTTFSTTYLIEEEFEQNIPIGAPIANSSAYIVNKSDNPQPIGIYGELLVSGDGLSLGYLNNPELTAEKFKFNKSDRSSIFYKTGDLARWLPDGNIHFVGRLDHQVKISGFRIEPGEIEKQLVNHEGVKEAVVTARAREKGDKYLCAYVVTDSQSTLAPSVSQLRDHLLKHLPDYMVPGHFVYLEEIPLNPNGKVDRKALPEPENGGEYEEYVAPQNETEEKVAAIWEEELEVSPIGINDDFFERGGHSLKAIGVTNKIEKTFGITIAIQDLFQHPTIADISRIIENSRVTGFKEIQKQPEQNHYELSYSQLRLWYITKTEPHNPLFNMPAKMILYEAVDRAVIRKVLEQLMARHESLRTSFKEINKQPVQVIEPISKVTKKLNLEVIDWSELPEAQREERRNRLVAVESVHLFNLEEAPLFRVKVVKCAVDEYDLVFNMHHIISDGWSMEVLKQEFQRLYEAYKTGSACHMEPLELQYKDYAAWQNQLLADKTEVGKANNFWKEQLSGTLPVLNLPYDFFRPSGSKESGGYRCVIPEGLTHRLWGMARAQRGSLFMVLLAGFNVLLSQITGQKDIVIAIPAAARQHEALKNIIGMFVNTLILRNHVSSSETFVDFFKRLQENTFKVLEYQGIPLELICGQLGIKYPDISVFFNLVNIGSTHRENVNDLNTYHMEKVQNAKFDIVCYLTEYKNGIEINCHYFKERFKPATIEKLMDLYSRVLENISAEPAKKIAEYSFRGRKRKLKPGR